VVSSGRTEHPEGGTAGPSWISRGIRLLVILAVLAISLWYSFAKVDWDELWQALSTISPLWIVASVAVSLLSHLLRASRWRRLIAGGESIPLRNSFSATMIGYMMSNLIPRSGEVIRPYVLARREKRPFSGLMASVFVDRILDGITLIALFIILLFMASNRLELLLPGYSVGGIMTAIAVPIALLLLVLVVLLYSTLGERILEKLDPEETSRIGNRIRRLLADFRAGISFGGARARLLVVLESIAIWLGYGISLYFGFLAFGFDERYGLGFLDMLPILAVTTVGISIAPTPGAFGVYHSFCTGALAALYTIPRESGVAYALVMHTSAYLATVGVGLFYLFRENMSFREVAGAGRGEAAGRGD
jgi:uncharacterized protein (TIRG00374 family)